MAALLAVLADMAAFVGALAWAVFQDLCVIWTVLSGGFLFLCWREYRRAREGR